MDIGTYGCAYALQKKKTYEDNPMDIKVNETWKSEKMRTHKTMTAVLLNVSHII